jgi:surfactin synthase thioesterase subunit
VTTSAGPAGRTAPAGRERKADLPRLLCIPGAGAAAGRFQRLRRVFADLVEVRTFELPGRGIRFAEESYTSLIDHVDHFVTKIEAEPYQRWIILGESLGSLTAAAVVRALEDSMRAEAVGVIAVAAGPRATGRRDNDEVIELLEADAEGSKDPENVSVAAKTILADIEAARSARQVALVTPMDVPIATIRGVDDGLIDDTQARRWEEFTPSGRWWFREVPGNHYQFENPTPELVRAVRDAIAFVTTR